MPPANSRYPSPPGDGRQDPAQRARTPPSYLSQALSEALESPVTQDVYNLAATLTTQADDVDDDDDHYDATLRSLRADLDQHTANLAHISVHLDHHGANLDQHQSRLQRSRDRLWTLERERSELEHRDRADRLRRVMNRLGRLHDEARGAYDARVPSYGRTADHMPAQDRLARLHNDAREARSAAYGDRVPNRNSLYDWSPANEADDEAELETILAELRREQPHTDPDILLVLGRSQLTMERERSRGAAASRLLYSSQPSQPTDSSLRSAAILQSVRRHPRFSARTRDHTQRFNADRDAGSRSPHPSDWRAAMQQRSLERIERREQARDRDMVARVDSFRRNYLDRTSNSSTTVSPMLEQTIKYLSKIRHSNSLDDSLTYAIEAGFLAKDYFLEDHREFVLDPFTIPPPAETSWLAPGAVLSGCQHATTVTSTVTTAGAGTSTTLYRFRNSDTTNSTLSGLFDSSNRWWPSHSTSPRNRSSNTLGPEIVTSHSPHQDRWPVKVTIHSVDYERMALSATMEAYNVPSHPHSHQTLLNSSVDGTMPSHSFTRTSSITTYLEGEILDFNTHTLLTESFKSTPANDATYWRKLPPFQHLTDEDLVRNLTSKTWFNEVLSKEWILMRWKERCFVKSLNRSTADPIPPLSTTNSFTNAPAVSAFDSSFHSSSTHGSHLDVTSPLHIWPSGTGDAEHSSFDDSGCGLTISGFYYVCLRRSDGCLEGLYYDPQSSPYQCLKLESVKGGVFPAWGFR
ncbi:hypothetical protein N0V90_000316 [Kalmusia sp. IMI 367209]|nr:hypothetical protein N0V90_000316 [Kalmusia sp. IMI 367209]